MACVWILLVSNGVAESCPACLQSERVDITAGDSPSGHYDPKNDVILSLEVMGATQTRVRISPGDIAEKSMHRSALKHAPVVGAHGRLD